jgi:hypothetical protein
VSDWVRVVAQLQLAPEFLIVFLSLPLSKFSLGDNSI